MNAILAKDEVLPKLYEFFYYLFSGLKKMEI